eukprot:scaffold5293_cov97-Skeletonema_marinoi.AAC.2
MSWRQALFIAVAGWKHRVAATSVSRPLLTALLLGGSIGCSSYCCYAFVINPLQKLTLDSRKILQNESDNHDRCLHPLYCPDRKQHATNIGSLLLATSSGNSNNAAADKNPHESAALTSSQKNQSSKRTQQQKYHNVFTVRGNHDDRALAAALGDEECARKSRYDWVKKGLSDEDIEWMAELPYTITIPSRLLKQPQGSGSETKQDQDVIVVHAGLLPNVSLVDQDTRTMTTIRDLISIPDEVDGKETKENIAKAWKGPELVIFGHDAKRGLQQEEYAIGLDTGCVYGKQVTGIILPEKKIVNVDASEVYSPINVKD